MDHLIHGRQADQRGCDPFVGDYLQQADILQALEGRTDGRTGNGEPFADLRLADPVARLDGQGDQLFFDFLKNGRADIRYGILL